MRGEQGTAMFSTDRAGRFDTYQGKEAPCAALTQPEPRLPGTKEGQGVRYTALVWPREREGVGGGYLLAGGAVVEQHTRRCAHLNPLNSSKPNEAAESSARADGRRRITGIKSAAALVMVATTSGACTWKDSSCALEMMMARASMNPIMADWGITCPTQRRQDRPPSGFAFIIKAVNAAPAAPSPLPHCLMRRLTYGTTVPRFLSAWYLVLTLTNAATRGPASTSRQPVRKTHISSCSTRSSLGTHSHASVLPITWKHRSRPSVTLQSLDKLSWYLRGWFKNGHTRSTAYVGMRVGYHGPPPLPHRHMTAYGG